MNRYLKRLLEWACVVGLLIIMAMLVLPGIGGPRKVRRPQCMSHQRDIALALQTYATNNNGQLPPAYIADESGRPMHSWRVLLLPYIEQHALYDRNRFDEPWNGPNNSELAAHIPDVYQCPDNVAARDEPQPWTSYVAIVGPHTMWPGAEPGTFDKIPDGASQTLLLVEVHDSGVHWMEPRDLDVETMALQVNPTKGLGISSPHRGYAHVIYADGHGGPLSDDVKPDILRQLIEIDDGGPTIEETP